LAVGIVKAERDERDAPVIVASVQTLARRSRRERLTPNFTLVVVDECHHAPSPSYRAVMEYLRCFDEDGPLTLGVTATPGRGDKVGLHHVFDAIVYRKDILSGIEEGYLCDLRGVQVRLAADLDRVRTRGGDFAEDELARELERADIPDCMVKAYQEHAPERKALAYLPSVRLATQTARLFREAGISAAALSGQTPQEERRSILAQLRDGHLRVVANCALLVEGYDEPSANAMLVGRPTKSRTLYVQIAGRGARPYPGKDDCLILDFVAATSRHDLVTLGDLFGLPPRLLAGRTVLEAHAEQEREEQERLAAQESQRQQRLAAREVDLVRRRLAQPQPRRPLHWAEQAGVFALAIPGGSLALQPVGDGYRAVRLERGQVVEQLAPALPLHYAQGVAEDWARSHQAHGLATPDAAWRGQPPSEKQIALLTKLGIVVPPGLSRGQASDLLTAAFALKTLSRRRGAG
jgi:superfamily II DNA or RNA helicase